MNSREPLQWQSPRVSRRERTSFVASTLTRLVLAWFCARAILGAVIGAAPDGNPGRDADPLRVSVYATGGDVLRYLIEPGDRDRAVEVLRRLGVSRVFLEGRRGDEYVAPDRLREIRGFLEGQGIGSTGGIATVPGSTFGTRQEGPLGWLNWESHATREGVSRFFRENAPVFDALIVDDFYCTGDMSPASEAARAGRSWGEYRRDLMVSLIDPLIVAPTRESSPGTRLILKFPQWYDRFHLFGYDPVRMSARFSAIWVGTEVRDPRTRRMGFVQPTEGYLNFRWLREVAGPKVVGAWFDHIECSAWNFVDQAWLSVLAGAWELTLFRLGDVMEGHPGDALLAEHLPALRRLAERVRDRARRGLAYYKPPDSDPGSNLYLMDYLAMLGWPILPVATYPTDAPAVVLGAQAAADAGILARLTAGLNRGQTVIATPAFWRALGPQGWALAGVDGGTNEAVAGVSELRIGSETVGLTVPLAVEAGLRASTARVHWEAVVDGVRVPLLTSRPHALGHVLTLAVRSFSDADFRNTGEWLLAPQALGLPVLPRRAADDLRKWVLAPLNVAFDAPSGVALHLFDRAACLYHFGAEPVDVRLDGQSLRLEPHECRWLPRE